MKNFLISERLNTLEKGRDSNEGCISKCVLDTFAVQGPKGPLCSRVSWRVPAIGLMGEVKPYTYLVYNIIRAFMFFWSLTTLFQHMLFIDPKVYSNDLN